MKKSWTVAALVIGAFLAAFLDKAPQDSPPDLRGVDTPALEPRQNRTAGLASARPVARPTFSVGNLRAGLIEDTKARAIATLPRPAALFDPVPPPARPTTPPPAETAYVSGSRVNLRRGPGTSHAKIGQFPKGMAVIVQDRTGGWARITPAPPAKGPTGWMSARYLSPTKPARVARSTPTRRKGPTARTKAQARQRMINRSIANYRGSCPCPYSVDRAGRRCGRRSAYSRPGGAAPLCYEGDISDRRVTTYLSTRR